MHDPMGTAAAVARSRPGGCHNNPRRAGPAILGGLWAARAVRGALALILLSAALALPALPVHADATDDLFKAAKGGTASEVKAALSAGARMGHRWVWESGADGADPSTRMEDGLTPLLWAAASNSDPSVITALIEGGADPDARNESGVTPLLMAAGNNANPSVIAALIEGGADSDAREGKYGYTPLHLAVGHNSDPSVIKALIEGGADPATLDRNGNTPFDYAKKGTDAYRLLKEGRGE